MSEPTRAGAEDPTRRASSAARDIGREDAVPPSDVSVSPASHEQSREPGSPGDDDDKDEPHPRKRQRVRLSCLECRRRKLSCDRGFPCERCIKSGTPERCTYETRPGLAPPAKNGLSQNALSSFDSRLSLPLSGSGGIGVFGAGAGDLSLLRTDSREFDRIRRLELEVAQLKNILSKQLSDGSTTLVDGSPSDHRPELKEPPIETPVPAFLQPPDSCADRDELRFFRGKEFKTRYFGPYNACMAFSELTGLSPFMKETSESWLKPLHIHNPKDRGKRKEEREKQFAESDAELEALLPSKENTDALVQVYLNQFEQIHRIVHRPSFRQEYAEFWDPSKPRYAAFTALVLAMMSISSCLHGSHTGKFVGMVSSSHHMAENWVKACEDWHARQSQKHRKLIHYQIACLIYLAKRVNTIKKKRFWTNAAALVHDGIAVGLHRDPGHMNDKISVYNQEMRRRIWSTLQEFDLQASFDHGLPTLLSTLHFDTLPPSNLDDDDFDENTTQLPPSRPTTQYTYASYQSLSRQSLPLRLELSRVLTGPPDNLDYEQVIRYTNDITAEIDALPSWDVHAEPGSEEAKKPLLAYTLLHIQLRQYIIPLHQPYLRLRKTNSKYQYSEIIYYNAARDMVLLHDKLTEQGVRTLNFLREDALTLAINLCSVTMLQPRGSTNMIMVNSQHTLKLLEKCLGMKEDRILRCGNNEPWGYSIMCAAYGLLEAHLGVKTSEAAKAASAQRFIKLHYSLLAWQDPPANLPGAAGPGSGPGPSPTVNATGQSWARSQPGVAAATPVSMFDAGAQRLDRGKSATPYPSASQMSSLSAMLGTGGTDTGPTPWWFGSMESMAQPANPDFSMEMLGLNVNELWGDSWNDY